MFDITKAQHQISHLTVGWGESGLHNLCRQKLRQKPAPVQNLVLLLIN